MRAYILLGGLEIRSVVTLAPFAFLASVTGSFSTFNLTLSDKFLALTTYRQATLALDVWGESHLVASPTGSVATSQKAWDQPVIDAQFYSLFQGSGAWLNAPPSCPCSPDGGHCHLNCSRPPPWLVSVFSARRSEGPQCGKEVDESGTHGLSCRRSQGRHPRHS